MGSPSGPSLPLLGVPARVWGLQTAGTGLALPRGARSPPGLSQPGSTHGNCERLSVLQGEAPPGRLSGLSSGFQVILGCEGRRESVCFVTKRLRELKSAVWERRGHKTCSGGTAASRSVGLTKQSKPNCINWNIGRVFSGNKSPPATECLTLKPQPSPSISLGAELSFLNPFWGFSLAGDPQKVRILLPQGCGRSANPSFLAWKGLKTPLEQHHSCQSLRLGPEVTPE